MSEPQTTRRRHGAPASQRRPSTPAPNAPEQPTDVLEVVEQPDVVDDPTCWQCGWVLHLSLAHDLRCMHASCGQYRVVVGTLVADRAVNDRLREAIAQATGEQRSDRPRPSPGPRTEPIKAQPPLD